MMFSEMLAQSARRYGSVLCLGWDPVPSKLPRLSSGKTMEVADFLREACELLAESGCSPAAFKPNPGYFYRWDRPIKGDFSGSRILSRLLDRLRAGWPEVPVIFDFKRGDIGPSSANYAFEAFEGWEADAVTVNPYMGRDSLAPFFAYAEQGKGVYVLTRTSNPGASDLQDLVCASSDGGEGALYVKVLRWLAQLREPACGAVVGATRPHELRSIALISGAARLPLLIPGVGKQGGDLATTLRMLMRHSYPVELARVNVSSGWLQPWPNEPPVRWREDMLASLRRLGEVSRTCWNEISW